EAVRRQPQRLVAFSAPAAQANQELKEFLHRRLYHHPQIIEERERAVKIIEELFQLYLARPERLPPHYLEQTQARAAGGPALPLPRVTCDYIAGMTDTYVFRVHRGIQAGTSLQGATR
ncbi:MAG: hypothetical protein ACE5HL_07490, partial [Terriglobia bacterium]